MADRIILLVAGLVLTFFAFWIGTEARAALIVAHLGPEAGGGVVVLVIMGFCMGIWAVVYGLVYAIRRIVRGDTHYAEGRHLVLALSGSIGSALAFGERIGPIGGGISTWVSPWDSLLIVGFLPLIFMVKDFAVEIKTKRRERTERLGVTKIRV